MDSDNGVESQAAFYGTIFQVCYTGLVLPKIKLVKIAVRQNERSYKKVQTQCREETIRPYLRRIRAEMPVEGAQQDQK